MTPGPAREASAAPRRSNSTWQRFAVVAFVLVSLWSAFCVYWQRASAELIETATLRLVSDDGSPVSGVQVRAFWTSWQNWDRRGRVASLGSSRADGTVDLAKLQGEWSIGAEFQIAVRLLGFESEPIFLERDTRIVLPPTGSVVVRVTDEQGRPPGAGQVQAQLECGEVHSLLRLDEQGSATFEPVACGSQLRLRASVDLLDVHPGRVSRTGPEAGTRAWIEQLQNGDSLRGPDEPGGVREVVCTIDDDAPALRGVVLGEAGNPVQGTFGLALKGPGLQANSFRVTTDARGRFAFLLDDRANGAVEVKLFTAATAHAHLVAIAQPDADGNLDAGTLRLQ